MEIVLGLPRLPRGPSNLTERHGKQQDRKGEGEIDDNRCSRIFFYDRSCDTQSVMILSYIKRDELIIVEKNSNIHFTSFQH